MSETTGFPDAPTGHVWAVKSLEFDDFEWFPWFTMGRLVVYLVPDYVKDFPTYYEHSKAWGSEASIRRAALRILSRREKTARELRKWASARMNPRAVAKRERGAAKVARRAAVLAARDSQWVGRYPPRKLGA